MSAIPSRLFTVKTGTILTTMQAALQLRQASVNFSIQPAGEAPGCTCGMCDDFLLTTDEAGVAVLESIGGGKIPHDLFVFTDSEGRIPFERRRSPIMAAPRYVQ